ncbi:MAG: hypothetical protein WC838_02450 [Candidatus Margulisiibacteriota bacterium]|jgi:hypothetical protein
MNKNILVITVDKRKASAVKVQKILTEWGCIIKTRLGIHDGVMDKCSEHGLIILELAGELKMQQQMTKLLAILPGVRTHFVKLGLK